MSFVPISLDRPHEWAAALESIPHGYWHTFGACKALSLGLDEPMLLCSHTGRDAGSRAVISLAERTWRNTKDIYLPAGFGGFVGSADAAELRREWNSYAAARGYVCGYFPLHPLATDPGLQKGVPAPNELFLVDLTGGPQAVFQKFDADTRRLLRRDGASNTRLVSDRVRLQEFIESNYAPFMISMQANPASAWGPATVRALCADPRMLLVGAEDDEGVCAAAMFGLTPHCADYLASIRVREGKRMGASIMWKAIELLTQEGIPMLHLGGGVRRDDSIARSKVRFGASAVPMQVAKEIYLPAEFGQLSGSAGEASSRNGGYFPPYRAPDGACETR
jgi:hypothetical protein